MGMGFPEERQRILAENGVTEAEWAILVTAGYYIPLPKQQFIQQAAWESRTGQPSREGDITEQQAAAALESCLAKGWAKLTECGHEERERNVLGEFCGELCIYPQDGVALTDQGHELNRRISIAIFGRDYFLHDGEYHYPPPETDLPE